MPPKKKQKLYTSLAEQQQLLEDLYNDLDDENFLGYESGGERKDESNISCSSSDTDVDVSDKDTDCTSQPVDEEDLVPRKQKFKNLDDVLDLNNYDILLPQQPITFHYSDAKGQFVMDWTTAKQGTSLRRAPNQNVIKHKPGPRRQAKQDKLHLKLLVCLLETICLQQLLSLPIQTSKTFEENLKM